MKKLFIVMVMPILASAQPGSKKDQVPYNLNSITYDIFPAVSNTQLMLPFKCIEVLDARFDSSKLGFELRRKAIDVDFKDFKKIHLEGGARNSIERFYNEYYKNSFKDSINKLLVVFKTLWIDNIPNRSFKESHRLNYLKSSHQDIFIKAEFYLNKNGDYYPLKRIDTVYQLTEQNVHLYDLTLKVIDLSFFTASLTSIIDIQQFNFLVDRATNGKKIKMAAIDSFNNNRFLLPVLTSEMRKGVFMSFNDFTNNSPIITNYKIDKFGILKTKSDSIDCKNFWAIADKDGIHLWAHSRLDNNSRFRAPVKSDMFREGNTFEFFINDDIVVPRTFTGNLLSAIIINPHTEGDAGVGDGSKIRAVMIPRQINMETGEVY